MSRHWRRLLMLMIALPLGGLAPWDTRETPHPWQPPGLAMTAQLTGDVAAVAVHGAFAVIGVGRALRVLDISQPTNPVLVGEAAVLATPVAALAFATTASSHGQQPPNFLYLTAGATLFVVDFTHPLSPTIVGSCDLPAVGEDIAVAAMPGAAGSWLIYAYVAAGEAGLRIIEVSDPMRPRAVGSYDTPGHAWRVAADLTSVPGQVYAHVTDERGYLYIVNVSDAAYPELTAVLDNLQSGDVAVADGYAYVGGNSYFFIVDLSDITQPQVVAVAVTAPIGFVSRLTVAERHVLSFGDVGRVAIVDVTNPQRPLAGGYYDTFGEPGGIATLAALPGQETPLAYLASGSRGLQVISGADPTRPQRLGWFDLPGNAYGVTAAGALAYVSDRDGGLHVVDVSQAEQPRQVAAYDSAGVAWNTALVGDVAYVAAGAAGLRIVDVHDPLRPWELGFFSPFCFIRDVAVTGHDAYATDRRLGRLVVLDVADPTHPQQVSVFDSPGGAYAVAAVGNLVYLADGVGGLRIVDVTKPDSPAEVGFWQSPGVAVDVVVSGTLAYVAGREEGLHIVDVSEPTRPQLLATFDTPGLVWGVARQGTFVYLADGPAGVRVVDVADPARPREAAAYLTPGYAWSVAAAGEHLYVAAESGGLVILRWAPRNSLYFPLLPQRR